MRRIKRVVLVGGTLPENLLRPERLYADPRIQKLAQEFQYLLDRHTQEVKGGPVNIQDYCQDKETFPLQYRFVATQALTAIAALVRWEELYPLLLEAQDNKDKLTHTALLGHSFGLWLAAFIAGLYDRETAMRLVIVRATSAWRENVQSLLVTREKHEPEIPLQSVQGVCRLAEYAWVSIFNHGRQILVAGTEPSVARVQAALDALLLTAQPYNNFAAWHTPLLNTTRDRLARELSLLQEPNKPRLPILFLDSRGRLRATKNPARIIGQMLNELPEPFDFEARALQLPPDIELHEVSTREYVGRLVAQVRENHAISASAALPTHQRKALLAHPA